MTRDKKEYICNTCNFKSLQWVGKCSSCLSWNSFVETSEIKSKKKQNTNFKKISQIGETESIRTKTGIKELDDVFGGGITKNSLTLLGGDPGVGKSTLLLVMCKSLVNKGLKVLYVSGEESEKQVAQRARRIEISHNQFYVAHETMIQNIKDICSELRPDFLIIDSVQTTTSNELASVAGSVSQVKEVTYELMNMTKSNFVTTLLVGHITKEGTIAGPKLLEHMVDTVLQFEGDRYGEYRFLRVNKNRFGSTHEVGLFKFNDKSLVEVNTLGRSFLDESEDCQGKVMTCVLEGRKPILVEVQSLVGSKQNVNTRITQGCDQKTVHILIAIIEKYFELPFSQFDIFVNVVGGIVLKGRESDLAIIASLLSSYKNHHLTGKTICLGEVGLAGEIRRVPNIELRLREIELLNFERVIVPSAIAKEYSGKYNINLIGIKNIKELSEYLS
jgi:DNA repair protein RadA/Sms